MPGAGRGLERASVSQVSIYIHRDHAEEIARLLETLVSHERAIIDSGAEGEFLSGAKKSATRARYFMRALRARVKAYERNLKGGDLWGGRKF